MQPFLRSSYGILQAGSQPRDGPVIWTWKFSSFRVDEKYGVGRICLARLLELSKTLAFRRTKKSAYGVGDVGDLSQRGNNSYFRNEV